MHPQRGITPAGSGTKLNAQVTKKKHMKQMKLGEIFLREAKKKKNINSEEQMNLNGPDLRGIHFHPLTPP